MKNENQNQKGTQIEVEEQTGAGSNEEAKDPLYKTKIDKFRIMMFVPLIALVLSMGVSYFLMVSHIRDFNNYSIESELKFIRKNFYDEETINKAIEDTLTYSGEKGDSDYYKHVRNGSITDNDYLTFKKYVLQLVLDDLNKHMESGYEFTNVVKSQSEIDEADENDEELVEKMFSEYFESSETLYVKLYSFSGEGLTAKFESLLREQPEADNLIVDLRHNPGGDTDNAAGICDLLLPSGAKIIDRITQGDVVTSIYAERDQTFEYNNVFVLVDEKSASASEYTTFSLMHNLDNVHVVGKTTKGKGIGQLDIPIVIKEGSEIITEGKYKFTFIKSVFIKDGVRLSYHGTGIEPDFPLVSVELEDIVTECINRVN